MFGRPRLKIIIALLFGLIANQPGLAKEVHASHTGASVKGTNSVHAKPAEATDTSVTVQPPRGGFARSQRNSNASLKIVKPENLARRRSNVRVLRSRRLSCVTRSVSESSRRWLTPPAWLPPCKRRPRSQGELDASPAPVRQSIP